MGISGGNTSGGGGGSVDVSTLATQTTLAAVLAKLVTTPALDSSLQSILSKLVASPALDSSLQSILSKLVTAPALDATVSTGNTALAALLTQAQDVLANGNITAINSVPLGTASANSAVAITPAGHGTLNIGVTGTYTGALSLQGTMDGVNWVTLTAAATFLNAATGAQSATITSGATGIFQFGDSGFAQIRITALAAVTGTAVITLRSSAGVSLVAMDAPLPTGANTIGNVTVSNISAGSVTSVPTTGVSPLLVTSNGTTNVPTAVKTSAGSLFELTITNKQATGTVYVKFYNKAAAPVVATDPTLFVIPVAAGATATIEFGVVGKRFSTGIAVVLGAAEGDTDTTFPGTGVVVSGSYI